MEGKASQNDALFIHLIWVFQAAAMQHLGIQPNPMTKKIEKDLNQAKISISILEMVKEKTSGNLSDEESKFLDHILTELRMEFVKAAERKEEGDTESTDEEEDSQEETAN
jgi:Ran GTPase-activating protein (RanGAP) involved in mRNA processing and transport